jgi:hypothetical protein
MATYGADRAGRHVRIFQSSVYARGVQISEFQREAICQMQFIWLRLMQLKQAYAQILRIRQIVGREQLWGGVTEKADNYGIYAIQTRAGHEPNVTIGLMWC